MCACVCVLGRETPLNFSLKYFIKNVIIWQVDYVIIWQVDYEA